MKQPCVLSIFFFFLVMKNTICLNYQSIKVRYGTIDGHNLITLITYNDYKGVIMLTSPPYIANLLI